MTDTVFFTSVNQSLSTECRRLCDFTDELDRSPKEKKERIAEYKCAKYRYASVSLIHSTVWNNNERRKEFNLKAYHHLLAPFDELLKTHDDYLKLCESAAEDEQPDYSLYYAMLAFVAQETEKLENKLSLASDWERVELTERIEGLQFARACLDEAWQKRKDGIT